MSHAPFLFVTKEFGVPATSGGMLRTLAMVTWLSERGPVVVAHPHGVTGVRRPAGGGEPIVETLRAEPAHSLLDDALSLGRYRSIGAPRTCGAALLTGVRESLDRLGPFRAAVVDHTCAFGVESMLPADLPVLLSTHNVESDLMRQRAAAETGWQHYAAAVEAVLLRRLETTVGRRRPTVVCTEADGAQVAADGTAQIVVARNGVTAPAHPGRADAAAQGRLNENELLFTGALDWRPNVNGILWLVESQAWRDLCARRPELVLTVAGRHPSQAFRERVEAAPGTRIEADVPSMQPLLERARLGIAPLLEGGGSRIKLLEYLAYGLPSVSTYVGASGLDGLPEAAIVQTPEDTAAFCAAIERALEDGPSVLSPATVEAMLARYGWDNALAPIGELIDAL